MAALRSPDTLDQLRARLDLIGQGVGQGAPALALSPAIDPHLPRHGLPRGAVHEVQAVHAGAAAGFCAWLLGRAGGEVVWIAAGEEPAWAPGLAALGLDVGRLILARCRSPDEGLWTLEESLRCPAVGGALLAVGPVTMTASRRLQLAAEGGGALGLLLRPAALAGGASSATTRWRVAASASTEPLTAWHLALLRCRGGRPGAWRAVLQGTELRASPVPQADPA